MDSIGLNLRFRSCYPLFLYIMLSSIKYNLIVAEILLVEESLSLGSLCAVAAGQAEITMATESCA